MFVGPNTIDFATVFTLEKFLEAAAVFATVVTVLVLFIPLAVICRCFDKKDKRKVCLFQNIQYNWFMNIYSLLCLFKM